MVKGLDELVDFAVERIALCGTQGANAYEVKTIIGDFYDSAEPTSSDAVPELAPSVDDRFCGTVWSWLCKHKDIRVQSRHIAAVPVAAPSEPPADPPASVTPRQIKEHYLTVKTTRMWHALTGHGPDHKRIAPMSFVVLSIIASHGAAGILQPEITSISGQDKRSVPKRTDELARKGYIEKRTVLAKGTHKTSLCTLIKFVDTTAAVGGDEETLDPAEMLELAFKDSVVRHEFFIQSAIPLIKQAGVITLNDLKRHYNIRGRRWESRVLSDFILRMEVMGLVAKLRAKIDGFENTRHTLRSIQFLREPTAKEIQTFCALGRLDSPDRLERYQSHHVDKAGDLVGEEQDDDDGFDGEPNEEQRREILGDLAQRTASDSTETIDWTPMLSINQNIFNVLESVGITGLSTMALIDRLGGPFYRRPIEHMTAQMTDAWEEAQPEYLRHMSIIRDVGQTMKFTYYTYRTYHYFDEAARLGHATWEAVRTSPEAKATQKPSKWVKNMPLDSWGFPKIREDLLLDEGYASAADARRALRVIHQPVRILGDGASFGDAGRGRIDFAGTTPTNKDRRLLAYTRKTLGTESPSTPAKRRGRPPKNANRRVGGLRAEPSGGASESDFSPARTPDLNASPGQQRGRPARTTRNGEAITQETDEDMTTPLRHSESQFDEPTPQETLLRSLPARPMALFIRQMQKVADRIARKELNIPLNQPLSSNKSAQEQHQVQTDAATPENVSITQQESDHQGINNNKKRDLSPTADGPDAKRLKLQPGQEAITSTIISTYRGRVKDLNEQLLNLQYPIAYVNPPQYLVWKRGRPRATALVVIKNDRLKDFAWFIDETQKGSLDAAYLSPGVHRRTREADRQNRSFTREMEADQTNSLPESAVLDEAAAHPRASRHAIHIEEGESDTVIKSKRSGRKRARSPEMIQSPAPVIGNTSTIKPSSRPFSDDEDSTDSLADFGRIEMWKKPTAKDPEPPTATARSLQPTSTKRRKLDAADEPATPSQAETGTTEAVTVDESPEASRPVVGSTPDPSPGMMKAKQFVASIDPSLKIPLNAAFIGMERQQPYGCVQCGKRYKNPGGLEYHVDNSERCYPERYAHTKRLKMQKLEAEQQEMWVRERELRKARKQNKAVLLYEDEDEHEIDNDYDDDDEYEEDDGAQNDSGNKHNAGKENDRDLDSPVVSDPPFTPLDPGKAADILAQPEQEEASTPVSTRPRKDARAKTGTMLGGGSIMHKRYDVVLDLLEKCDGAIPGDRALHPVYVTVWRSIGGAGSPDIDTLRRTINNLVAQLKVNRLYLTFKAGGAIQTANILTLPEISPTSEVVMKTLHLFEQAFPRMPIPPGYEVADDLKKGLQYYPGNSVLAGRTDRYPANDQVTVKRLQQPLMPLIGASKQAPAWKQWAEMNTIPSKADKGDSDTYYTRDDILETTLDEIREGVRLPSGHLAAGGRRRQSAAARRPRKRRSSPSGLAGSDSMHMRIQQAKEAREREIVDDLAEIAALEAEISEEQAEMQSSFSLGDQYRASRFEPRQIAMSGGRGNFRPPPGKGQLRWRPWINADALIPNPISDDTIAVEDLAQDIPEDQAPQMTMPRLDRAPAVQSSRLVFPDIKRAAPMVQLHVNPMGWVTGLGRSVDSVKPIPKLRAGFKSLETVFPARADGGRSLQGIAPGSALMSSWSSELPAITTLTDPDQIFQSSSGTFSTNFSVRRKLRPHLQISAPPQVEYETRMAAAFNELAPDLNRSGESQADFYNIDEVEKWESTHREDLTANMELIQTRWINHTVGPDVAADVIWTHGNRNMASLIQPFGVGTEGLLRRSRRNKVLRRPPIRPRKEPASEPQTIGDTESFENGKRKSAKARRTRAEYANENGLSASQPMMEAGKRGPQTKRYMKKEQIDRALGAIVLAQVLAGGKVHTLDWRVVECALNDENFDMNFLRHRWFTIRNQNSIRLVELRGKFQKAFLQAAEKGEIDIPDFENAADYDWHSLHRWTMENVVQESKHETRVNALSPLPSTRLELDEEFSLGSDDIYHFPDQDQYKPLGTIQRKGEIMTECDWSRPLHEKNAPSIEEVNLESKAESWLRANVLSKGNGYDARTSRAVLEQLPGPILDQALTTYLDKKWLRVLNKGRLGPGRNYVTHSDFSKLLRPDARDKDICQPAVSFKLALDQNLAEQQETLSTLHSKRGECVTLLNLLAAGRVELQPILPQTTHDPDPMQVDASSGVTQRHLSVFGLAPGSYITKNLAKDEFNFDVCVRSTSKYVPGTGPIPAVPAAMPPTPAPHLDTDSGLLRLDRPTPMWYDLQGRLNTDTWKQILMCVVLDLVSQCGRDSEEFARRYDGAIAAWELECVLEWLQSAGIARRIVRRDGSLGGWIAAEWWWCLFGPESGDAEDEAQEDDEEGGNEDQDEDEQHHSESGRTKDSRRVSFLLPNESAADESSDMEEE